MNIYDSQKILDIMKQHGYNEVSDISDANVVIVNTCNIREKACDKLYSELGRMRSRGSNATIVVAGCVAQAEGDEVFRRAPNVDIIVGPQSIHRLPELLGDCHSEKQIDNRQVARKRKHAALDFDFSDKFDSLPEPSSSGVSAFISIQEGCDKFCHFCCVPYTRGSEYSRPVAEIMEEAKKLVAVGAKELVLLGQNVNAYRGWNGEKTVSLGWLMRHISSSIDELKRIRYTSSHPNDMHNDLYEAHAFDHKVMPFLHLPVQSGSDRVLKAMNRRHGVEYYLQIIDKMRRMVPGVQFSSDFIVGYPGETDEDFEQTMELVRKVHYAQAFSFKYSPRPGTPAANKDDISDEIKSERLHKLQNLLNQQQRDTNMASNGKIAKVLIERLEGSGGVGRTQHTQLVHVKGNVVVGKEAAVMITEFLGHSLIGEVINEAVI